MYTVLIQSRKAMDSYQQFEPILSVNKNSDAIDVCAWNAGANTIDTAVPELMGKVQRIRQWRAIVIQTELPGSAEDKYRIRDNNPFDYEPIAEENKKNDEDFPFLVHKDGGKEEICPSVYPMVLISQLLGGIPAKSPDYDAEFKLKTEPTPEPDEDDEENTEQEKPEETEELIVIQQQRSEALHHYKELCDEWTRKYAFAGSPPTEIILIRLRRVSFVGVENSVSTGWLRVNESKSSRFWERMGYPYVCRYLTFDVDTRGSLQEEGDMFRFWNAVLLLAGARIDSNTLQPYRLYRLDVQLDPEKLRRNFQATANRLNYARYRMDRANERQAKEEKEAERQAELPSIEVKTELDLERALAGIKVPMPVEPEFLCESKEEATREWEQFTQTASENWARQQVIAKRKIGAAAEKTRRTGFFPEEEIVSLSQDEKEDLEEQLADYYQTIVTEQGTLPVFDYKYLSRQFAPMDREVHTLLERKITRRSARRILAGLAAAAAIGAGCGFWGIPFSEMYYPAAVMGGTFLLSAAGVGIGLSVQRRQLLSRMMAYYREYQRVQDEQKNGGRLLAAFFGHVGSSMRGNSYLHNLEKHIKGQDEAEETAARRGMAISVFQDTLSKWSDALNLGIDFDDRNAMEEMIEQHFAVDFELLFSLEASRNHRTQINKGGKTIASPYDYIVALLIEREEVYDE